MPRRAVLATAFALATGWAVLDASATMPDPFQIMGVERPAHEFPAPSFRLATLDGTPVELENLHGRVVLLYFWRTWCPYCRRDLPAIIKLEAEFHETGLVLLGITSEPASTVGSFLAGNGHRFTTLLDPRDLVADRYRFHVTPTIIVIGRDGQVRGRVIGTRDWDSREGRAFVRHLLAPVEAP